MADNIQLTCLKDGSWIGCCDFGGLLRGCAASTSADYDSKDAFMFNCRSIAKAGLFTAV